MGVLGLISCVSFFETAVWWWCWCRMLFRAGEGCLLWCEIF